MSAPDQILIKIRLLLNLTKSTNVNEAENAQAMVDKLVAKYNITPEELKSIEDKKPLYGEENKVFQTIGLIGWKQQLVLAIGKYFYCQIVQEIISPSHGIQEYTYYVYGEPEDENNTKFVFNSINKRIEEMINNRLLGRGPVYVSSYGEGVVESIKNNIYWDGIDLPEVKRPTRPVTEESVLSNSNANLTKTKEEKEKPAEESVDVNTQSIIKDLAAYFRGLQDGKNFSLSEILELEAETEEAKKLQSSEEINVSTPLGS